MAKKDRPAQLGFSSTTTLLVYQLFLPLGLAGFSIGLCQCVSETPTDRTGISANLVQFRFSLSQCRRVIQSYIRDRVIDTPVFIYLSRKKKKKTTVCSAYLWLFICLFETSSAPSCRPPHPTLKRKKLSQPNDCETPA